MGKGHLPFRQPAFLLLFFLFFGGCGIWNITPSKGEIEAVRTSGRMTAVTYAPSPFIAQYPGIEQMKYESGLYWYWQGVWEWPFEWNAMKQEGERLERGFGIEDPSIRVMGDLAGYLEKDAGFPRITIEKGPISDDSVPALRKTFGNEGTILDFKTTSWRLSHFAIDVEHYGVSCDVRGRLIDLKNSKILWRGWCSFTGGKTAQSPTFEELTANGGERLKEMLTEAADNCAGEFKAQFRRFK